MNHSWLYNAKQKIRKYKEAIWQNNAVFFFPLLINKIAFLFMNLKKTTPMYSKKVIMNFLRAWDDTFKMRYKLQVLTVSVHLLTAKRLTVEVTSERNQKLLKATSQGSSNEKYSEYLF